jgi:hypothetical protein
MMPLENRGVAASWGQAELSFGWAIDERPRGHWWLSVACGWGLLKKWPTRERRNRSQPQKPWNDLDSLENKIGSR